MTQERIAVELTQEHIDKAGQLCYDCLGAQAAQEHFNTDDVWCLINRMSVRGRNYRIDDDMAQIISDYWNTNDKSSIKPRTFYLTEVNPHGTRLD